MLKYKNTNSKIKYCMLQFLTKLIENIIKILTIHDKTKYRRINKIVKLSKFIATHSKKCKAFELYI